MTLQKLANPIVTEEAKIEIELDWSLQFAVNHLDACFACSMISKPSFVDPLVAEFSTR